MMFGILDLPRGYLVLLVWSSLEGFQLVDKDAEQDCQLYGDVMVCWNYAWISNDFAHHSPILSTHFP